VAGILRHPWFRTELSPKLISLNHDLLDLPTAVRPACRRAQAALLVPATRNDLMQPCMLLCIFCPASACLTRASRS
jgi:hypothetical protein